MNKKVIRQYAVAIIFALVLFFVAAFSQGLFQQESLQELFGCLSDCFLLPGVMLGGMGILTWISKEGGFDMLAYGFSFFFNRLFHPREKQEAYYEYKMRKYEGPQRWLKQWLLVGLVCFGFSVIFLLLYLAQS